MGVYDCHVKAPNNLFEIKKGPWKEQYELLMTNEKGLDYLMILLKAKSESWFKWHETSIR